MNGFFLTSHRFSDRIEPGNGQQPKTNQQKTRDCTTTKRHNQGRVHSIMGGLRGSHIGANRNDHTHIPGNRRGTRADQEPCRRE